VKLLQVNLKKLQVESNKRDAKLYANMFDRTTKESDVSKVTSHFIFLSALYEYTLSKHQCNNSVVMFVFFLHFPYEEHLKAEFME
jgi:hypothetical protein